MGQSEYIRIYISLILTDIIAHYKTDNLVDRYG